MNTPFGVTAFTVMVHWPATENGMPLSGGTTPTPGPVSGTGWIGYSPNVIALATTLVAALPAEARAAHGPDSAAAGERFRDPHERPALSEKRPRRRR